MRGVVVTDADFEARPAGADRAAQVDASYEKLSESSAALKRYFGLDADAQAAALAGAGLDWLGDDTIGGGRDIMHSEMRTLGPIHKVVRAASGYLSGMGLGSG